MSLRMPLNDAIKAFSYNSDKNLIGLHSLCKQYVDICEEWQLTEFKDNISPRQLSKDAKYEISNNVDKLERKDTICVVYGRVNSGKSMIINSIIGRRILPSGNGFTTNSIIRIRKSEYDTDYVIYPDSPDRKNINTIHRVDYTERSVMSDSNVEMFISRNNCGELKDNVVIIDTPGIDRNMEMDATIHKVCMQADLLILVVNSISDISETDKNFLLKHKTRFSKFKLLIIFNHWDGIIESKKDFFKDEYMKVASKYLWDDLKVNDNQDDGGIFFLSALEYLKIRNNETITLNGWEEREQSYKCFIAAFNRHCCISNNNRRLAVKNTHFDIITEAFEGIKINRDVILQRIIDKVKESLSKLINTNEIINKAVDNLFAKYYEDYFNRGLDIIKQRNSKNKSSLRIAFMYEQMTVMIESLKIKIKDFVPNNEVIDKTFAKLYFQYYVNADNHIEVIKSCNVYSDFQTKIKDNLKDSYHNLLNEIPNLISKSILETENDLNKFGEKIDNFKDQWGPLFMETIDTTQSFISNEDKVIKILETVCNQYEEIYKEWPLRTLEKEITPSKLSTDLKYEITYNDKKLERKETICLIFGKVSSGKSMLTNAMIGREVLPSGKGSTTNSFVTIRKSIDNTEFVIFPDSTDRMDISNINRVDVAERNLQLGSKVDLFLSGYQCDILQDNLSIIDTPGIDTDAKMDVTIHDMCKKADLLILVVNSTNDISETDKNFLLKHKTIFSKFNLLIVFNHWDEIDNSKKEFLKNVYSKGAINYLCNDLGVNINEAKERIFFLSAMETLKNSNTDKFMPNECEERNQSFNCFINLFNQFVGISVNKRLSTVMKNNFEIIEDGFNLSNCIRCNLQDRFREKVFLVLNNLNDMNTIINNTIGALFVQNYEIFFHRGLNTIRMNESELENAASIMNIFISEQMVVIVESLKIIINEMISGLEDKDKDLIMKVFEKLYFYYYLNVNIMIEAINKTDLYPVFNEILTTIRLHSKLAIAGVSAVGTVIVAPIGVGIGIVAPVIDAIAIPVAVFSFAGVGSVGSAITSRLALMRNEIERAVFKPRYADHEFHILHFWDIMRAMLTNSYDRFLENLPKIILMTISKNGNHFNDLEHEVNQFKEKWKHQ